MITSRGIVRIAALALAFAMPGLAARASSDPAMDASVSHVQRQWEHIVYQVKGDRAQLQQIKAVEASADALVARYPGRAEPLIWDGIVKSEEAGKAGGLEALGDAKQARQLFERAYAIDRTALEAGAPTSLGVLYYRVPGFPLGFGDKTKARRYLVEAVALAPNGMDANYFYGDFLASQGEYGRAAKVLQRALAAPPHPDRPIWDTGRRAEIRARLQAVNAKLRTAS